MNSLVHRLLVPMMSADRPQWVRTAGRHLQVYLYVWAWFWAICLVGIAVAITVVAQVGTVNVSIVQFVRNGPLLWFLFVLALIVASTFLTPHVAHGMTRRSFARGALAAGLVIALAHSILAGALILLEGVLYEQMGWDHDLTPGAEYTPGIWEQGAGALLLDYGLATFAATVSGLLVFVAYQRLGGWLGTLALPLTMAPIFVLLVTTGWSDPAGAWHVGRPLGTAVAVAVVAAATVAFPLLTRNVAISRA